MSNRPNRAHNEAPAMSFEQQVAQVLDSLTKELPMSEPPTGPLDAANEYAARSTAGTIIPDLGITFAEAAERYRSLRQAEMEASQRGDQGAADDANRQHCRLADQIMAAAPSTAADALVILGTLADREMGIAAGIDDERAQRALERVYGLLSTTRQLLTGPKEGELSAMVCRWLELRDIASPTERQSAELDRLADRIAAYQPHSTADAMAHLGFVLAYYMGDSTFDLESDDSCYARALQKGLAYFASAGDPAAGTLYRLGSIGLTDARAFWIDTGASPVADAFAEAGAAFEAQAPDTLSMPLELTDRMIDAGASAAGITPEQFKAAVQAARESRAA